MSRYMPLNCVPTTDRMVTPGVDVLLQYVSTWLRQTDDPFWRGRTGLMVRQEVLAAADRLSLGGPADRLAAEVVRYAAGLLDWRTLPTMPGFSDPERTVPSS